LQRLGFTALVEVHNQRKPTAALVILKIVKPIFFGINGNRSKRGV